MNPSDYRRDYAAYFSAVERERFEHHAGLKRRPELQPTEERYAELWTRASVEDLRRALEETPEQFETERAGLRALDGAAGVKHAEAAAREVTEELRRCSESARVEGGGSGVSCDAAADLIADEADAARRRELARRQFDAARAYDDLRAARLEALNDAARALGFDRRRALYESFTGANLWRLAADAEVFLERTGSAVMSRLAEWAARELPPGASPRIRPRARRGDRRGARVLAVRSVPRAVGLRRRAWDARDGGARGRALRRAARLARGEARLRAAALRARA